MVMSFQLNEKKLQILIRVFEHAVLMIAFSPFKFSLAVLFSRRGKEAEVSVRMCKAYKHIGGAVAIQVVYSTVDLVQCLLIID